MTHILRHSTASKEYQLNSTRVPVKHQDPKLPGKSDGKKKQKKAHPLC